MLLEFTQLSTMSTDPEALKNILIKKRGGHKAYMTKIMNEAAMLISTENPKNKVKKTLSKRKDVISNLDNEVLSMLNDDEIEAEIMTSGDYLMSIDETIFGVADALERLTLNDD